MLLISLVLVLIGAGVVLCGKIPFITKYNGVREGKEKLHCRIEGGVLMVDAMIIILQHFDKLSSITMSIIIIMSCVVALALEIGFKVIK